MTNLEYAQSLRLIADFYEANADQKQPHPNMWIHCYEREEFLKAATGLARGGMVAKRMDEHEEGEYYVTREFGGIKLEVLIRRKMVCRLVTPAVYDCPESLLEEASEYGK
jgi:hypothetical protein